MQQTRRTFLGVIAGLAAALVAKAKAQTAPQVSPMPIEEVRYESQVDLLYPKQREAVFDNRKYAIIEASTKAGKTSACILWIWEQAYVHGAPGRNYWWVAPVSDQARIAFRRMMQYAPRSEYQANLSDRCMHLSNGTVIWFKSADKSDSLFGEDVYAAVIDEASRVKEDAWFAVRSTLTYTRGPVRIIGNVKGRKNWFYQLARRAEKGEPDMGYHRMVAYDAIEAGVLSVAEVEDARHVLPDHAFKELYLAEPSDDTGNPFGGDEAIDANVVPDLSFDNPFVWGWDLAKSVDWSVGIALDSKGHVCRFDRFRIPWGETIARIRRSTRYVSALVDSTGVGDPIVEELQRGSNNYEGYHFSPSSKQKLMEGLAAAIQSHTVSYPAGPITIELKEFEYSYTAHGVRYSAPDNHNDDCVMALALAVYHRSHTRPMFQITDEQIDAARHAPDTRRRYG